MSFDIVEGSVAMQQKGARPRLWRVIQAECGAMTIEIVKSSRNLSLQGTVALTRSFPRLGAPEQRKSPKRRQTGQRFHPGLGVQTSWQERPHRVHVTANSCCFGHTPR